MQRLQTGHQRLALSALHTITNLRRVNRLPRGDGGRRGERQVCRLGVELGVGAREPAGGRLRARGPHQRRHAGDRPESAELEDRLTGHEQAVDMHRRDGHLLNLRRRLVAAMQQNELAQQLFVIESRQRGEQCIVVSTLAGKICQAENGGKGGATHP